MADPGDVEAPAQHLNGPVASQRLVETGHQHLARVCAVHGDKAVPFVGLGGLDPGLQILGVERETHVVAGGGPAQPALRDQPVDDVGFEMFLMVQIAHAALLTSIFPVTAAVINAARFSLSRAMLCSVLVMSVSILAVCAARLRVISSCSSFGGTGQRTSLKPSG